MSSRVCHLDTCRDCTEMENKSWVENRKELLKGLCFLLLFSFFPSILAVHTQCVFCMNLFFNMCVQQLSESLVRNLDCIKLWWEMEKGFLSIVPVHCRSQEYDVFCFPLSQNKQISMQYLWGAFNE